MAAQVSEVPQPATVMPPDDDSIATSTPECHPNGKGSIDPSTLEKLVKVFCRDGMGSTNKTLSGSDLDPSEDLKGVSADFSFKEITGNCPRSCVNSFADMIQLCTYRSRAQTLVPCGVSC